MQLCRCIDFAAERALSLLTSPALCRSKNAVAYSTMRCAPRCWRRWCPANVVLAPGADAAKPFDSSRTYLNTPLRNTLWFAGTQEVRSLRPPFRLRVVVPVFSDKAAS